MRDNEARERAERWLADQRESQATLAYAVARVIHSRSPLPTRLDRVLREIGSLKRGTLERIYVAFRAVEHERDVALEALEDEIYRARDRIEMLAGLLAEAGIPEEDL